MKVLNLSLLIVIIDQISKILVKGISIPFLNINITGMEYGQSIPVIGEIFKFTFVENPGMAFGINVDGYFKLFLSLFSLLASVAIVVYIYKVRNQKLLFRIALALILGGAVGNLIDRFFYGIIYGYAPLLYGRVVDFLHFDALGFTVFGKTFDSFPIFNVADSSVTIGVFILLIFHKSFEESSKAENNQDSNVVVPANAEIGNGDSIRESNQISN
ncbi:MAG: signal peptidase II [Ignavibacteriales bacterium]|nr:signal peptidase II [Ignavibacteriales bacterium]